jgi:chromosome segregation ATPase
MDIPALIEKLNVLVVRSSIGADNLNYSLHGLSIADGIALRDALTALSAEPTREWWQKRSEYYQVGMSNLQVELTALSASHEALRQERDALNEENASNSTDIISLVRQIAEQRIRAEAAEAQVTALTAALDNLRNA